MEVSIDFSLSLCEVVYIYTIRAMEVFVKLIQKILSEQFDSLRWYEYRLDL